nr:MAG TPA: hypothetical protein [Caudoviricetes sp.]
MQHSSANPHKYYIFLHSIALNMLHKKYIQCNDMTRNMTRNATQNMMLYSIKERIDVSLSFPIIMLTLL